MSRKIIIWDNDGTVMGSRNPNDSAGASKIILPNVEQTMNEAHVLNILCSGCKTPESELQNFDPENIIQKFKGLMDKLPISIATFSPAIGGVECYAIIKKKPGEFDIRQSHKEARYKNLIGQFKKPGIGMLIVIQDLLDELYSDKLDPSYAIMIGDSWHDEEAAKSVGIPFVKAQIIHNNSSASKP